MIIFNAYTKDSGGNYTQAINGKLTFTFSNSLLLDERLNEAYLYIVRSSIPYFEPTTEIKVVVNDGTNEKPYYFIIASDRAQELPNGSGKYKHEIHLLERTKLLEGIYCQSITFTNSQGNVYTKNPLNVRPVDASNSEDGYTNPTTDVIDNLTGIIKSPIPSQELYTTPTPSELSTDLIAYLKELYNYPATELEQGITRSGKTFYTGVSVNINGNITTQNGTNATLSVMALNPVIVIYTLVVQVGTDNYLVFKIAYTINAVKNQYPLKPWTITDCVNRCLDLCEPIFEGETPRFTFAPEQATKYANIYAPEFTMTQCTLREQLKVIGGFIHAEPRLGGYDENGVWQDNYIFFDPYDETTEAKISSKPYIYKAYSRDINEYCTHIETSASNIVNALNYAQGVVTEPNIIGDRTLRTESVNVIISENNAYASTDNKIYDIPSEQGSVLVTLYDANGNTVFNDVDITPYIFRDSEYNNLSSYGGGYPYTKHYALYYTQGQEGIRGLFYKVDNAIDPIFSNYAIVNIVNAVTGGDYKSEISSGFNRLAFKITYVPIYDTKFSHSKQSITLGNTPFMRVYNQSENLIETRYYGENIKAISAKMGNVESTRTYILKSVLSVPELAQTIDGFAIVDIKCEFLSEYIKCTVQLAKDFRVNQYVGISSNKRVFEVSEANAYARDILLKNYVVISDNAESVNDNNAILGTLTPIMQIFNPSIENKVINPINAVRAYSYSKTGDDTTAFGNVLLPVISSAFGNAMVFSWDYKDNYSAGTEASVSTFEDTGNEQVSAIWQRDIAYGDYYGRAYYHIFGLYSTFESNDNEYEQAQTVSDLLGDDISDTTDIKTPNALLLRKDNRERLSFNYEIEFVTTQDDIIIGSALASSCPLVTRISTNQRPQLAFYNGKIGKFDKKIDTSKVVKVVDGQYTPSSNGISFDVPTPGQYEFDSWALISPINTKSYQFEDEDGNISQGYVIEGGEILLARNKSSSEYASEGKTTEAITFQIARTIYN